MSYAIIRNENHKVGVIPLLERHNERLNHNYSNKDIDINHSAENYHLKKIQAESYLQEIENLGRHFPLLQKVQKSTQLRHFTQS